MEAVESSMDLLQAEIGAMSKDSDKRMFKVDKLQADLTIHKAGGARDSVSVFECIMLRCDHSSTNSVRL